MPNKSASSCSLIGSYDKGLIFEEIDSSPDEKSFLQKIESFFNLEESIDNNVKEGPKTDAFTLSEDLWASITLLLNEKLFTFLLSPFHGICNPSILNSEPTL